MSQVKSAQTYSCHSLFRDLPKFEATLHRNSPKERRIWWVYRVPNDDMICGCFRKKKIFDTNNRFVSSLNHASKMRHGQKKLSTWFRLSRSSELRYVRINCYFTKWIIASEVALLFSHSLVRSLRRRGLVCLWRWRLRALLFGSVRFASVSCASSSSSSSIHPAQLRKSRPCVSPRTHSNHAIAPHAGYK